MALQNLFIRTRKTIGEIQLDAFLSESHITRITRTNNPIELGVNITDHSVVEPDSIFIRAVVTDSPNGLAAATEIIDTITGLFGSSTSEGLTRSQVAYNALVQLQKEREPISIQTGLKLYTNMLIDSVTTVRDKESARVVFLDIAATEVLITQSELVTLSAEQLGPGAPRQQGSPPEEKGRQEPVAPTTSTQTSVLKSVFDWVRS